MKKMQMILKANIRKSILTNIGYVFCQNNQNQKIETVSFKRNTVNDFSKIAYEPQQKLNFVNGKCLVYQNKRTWITTLLHSSYYWGSIAAISYLIYINPFADFFPAAIPILVFMDIAMLKLWLNKIKWNQNMVSEIYLYDNGEATQIYFANKMKRKLFGEQQKKVYYNSIFVNPDFEKQQVILMDKDNRVFPNTIKQAQKQSSGYAWVKHFSNGQNFLVVPKKPNYANLKVLIQIFKGKIIKNKIV